MMKSKGNKKSTQMSELSVNDFMTTGFAYIESDQSDSKEVSSMNNVLNQQRSRTKRRQIPHQEATKKKKISIDGSISPVDGDENSSDSDSDLEDSVQHKAALSRLRKKDPEFFKYLSENDKDLLNFDATDEESDDGERGGKYHKPSEKLEVDSDGSEFSGDEETPLSDEKVTDHDGPTVKVTISLIEKWRNILQEEPDLETIRSVIYAFQSAVDHASDTPTSTVKLFVVEGNTAFNGVIKICLVELLPAIHHLLKLPAPTLKQNQSQIIDPVKCKLWPKLISPLKIYLNYVIKMLSKLCESDLMMLLLRHVLHLIPFFIPFVKHSRVLLKVLVTSWCTSDESVRVLAFISIIRLSRTLPKEYLDFILKKMYLSYVRNCKFTSPTTWPLINFMKRSLVELYCLDYSLAYQQSFIYIRQLAIHLRNAITMNQKDSFQAVYNWQYIHCLLLWAHLIGNADDNSEIKPLLYPLTQVILGTIKLIPTAKYFPLRLHLTRALTTLCHDTRVFIPVLPLILEVLEKTDFEKKSSTLSMKPVDFTCALKLSKSQLGESGFKDTCVDKVYEHCIDYLNVWSHIISFPEMVLPTTVQLKSFVKTCKTGNYVRKMKQLIEKIEENSNFIKTARNKVTFGISDFEKVDEWEKSQISLTPIHKFYSTWRKIKDRDTVHSIAMKDHLKTPDEKFPKIERSSSKKRNDKGSKSSELFHNESSDEETTNFMDSENDKMSVTSV